MALNANMVEQLCTWCSKIDSLADTREAARRDFFGCDEPGEVHYEEGAGYPMIRDRRFLGWFALTSNYRMDDTRLNLPQPLSLLAAIKHPRFIPLKVHGTYWPWLP